MPSYNLSNKISVLKVHRTFFSFDGGLYYLYFTISVNIISICPILLNNNAVQYFWKVHEHFHEIVPGKWKF